MMNKLLMGAIAASGLIAMSGCSDTFDPSSDSEGRILLNLDLNREVAAPKQSAKSRAGQAKEITATDLKLTLKADDGSMERSWASLTDFDNSEDFPVGMYTMEASYGSETEEGFDKPYYFGSTALRIRENETTPANITARLGNAMVTVVYTEAVGNYFSACKGEVVSVSGTQHDYTLDETRALYVQPGHVEINASFTKQNGVSGKVNVASFDAEPRNHYIVTVDANGGEVGNGVLVITFNSELATEEVEIDLSDDILTAPAPQISASGFTGGEPLTVVEGAVPAGALRMTVTAQGGVNTAVLTVRSASLREQGWPETVDFSSADAATLGRLRGLGLEFFGLEGVKSKMAVVDFTKVLQHIAYVEGGDNTSEFTLVAKDAYSKVSEPLTLSVAVEKLSLSIENVQPLAADETALVFDMAYNGTDPAANVKFQTKNTRGTWDDAVATSVEPLSRARELYRVTLAVPADGGDVVFRAVSGNVVTEEQSVVRSGAGVAMSDGDVFAKHALLSVQGAHGADLAASARVMLSTNGTDFSEYTDTAVSGSGITLNNLTPATKYYVKLDVNNGVSKTLEFTTEVAAQLPNAGMDEWYGTQRGDYQTWWFPATSENGAWATMNAKTTSTFGKGSSIFSYGGTAYRATSGTMPANANIAKSPNANAKDGNQKSGTNAALIRTVGWGSGNTAAGGLNGECKNITAGELFLGSTDASFNAVRGMAFASRPVSMSFYAKYYTVKSGNGDFGVAEIKIKDSEGDVIAQKRVEIGETSDYTPFTLAIDYPANSRKAASIEVNFSSSGNSACLSKNSSYLSDPGFGSHQGEEYVGSQLYIDDIALNY